MKSISSTLSTNRCLCVSRGRCVRSEAAASLPPFTLQPNCVAYDTAQALMAATKAKTSCDPYMELASDTTLILNPPWTRIPRAQGMDGAECGVLTDTEYSSEDVHVLAGHMEDDGSGFLLWERKAKYTEHGQQHHEDICGCSYIQMSNGKAEIIATFRQPTPAELAEFFKPGCELVVLPGKDNFFRGRAMDDSAATSSTMLRAVNTFYNAWSLKNAEESLAEIASKKLHVLEPIWQQEGDFLPVNRVEAAMWIERQVKRVGGELHYEPKVLSRAPKTNLVFALWVATGPQQLEVTGVHVFSFDEGGMIDRVAAFREPFPGEKAAHLRRDLRMM